MRYVLAWPLVGVLLMLVRLAWPELRLVRATPRGVADVTLQIVAWPLVPVLAVLRTLRYRRRRAARRAPRP